MGRQGAAIARAPKRSQHRDKVCRQHHHQQRRQRPASRQKWDSADKDADDEPRIKAPTGMAAYHTDFRPMCQRSVKIYQDLFGPS